MRTALWLAATAAVFGLLALLQHQRMQAAGELSELESLGYFQFQEPMPLADVDLIHTRNRVTHPGLGGRWTIVFFGFTFCPDVCPTTLSVLNLALDRMDVRPRVVMVSVDPERDDVAALRAYVEAFNGDFEGFTGDPGDIRKLADSAGIAYEKVGSGDGYLVEHHSTLVVLDPQGRHVGYVRPPHNPGNLRKIFRRLLR